MLTRSGHQRLQECVCCCESKKLDRFPLKAPTSACAHDVETCLDCLQRWWTSSISSQYWTVFECPNCPEILFGDNDFETANMLAEDSNRCNDIYDRIRNGLNPDYRFCMQPSCRSGQICHDPDTLNCQRCNEYDCVRCDAPFHYHCASHEDYQETIRDRIFENELSMAYIEILKAEGKIMKCPNCACLIESYGRATKVKCTRCIYGFLWDDERRTEDEEMGGMVDHGGGESDAEMMDSAGERHVTFPEDEAYHRIIRPLSTELGPEMAGTGA